MCDKIVLFDEIFLDKRSVHEAAIIALHHEANASQIDIGEQIQ